MSLLLGIDLGTSTAKALLFDPTTAQTVAVVSQEYPLLKPQPHYAEQNPLDWWQTVVSLIQRLTHQTQRGHEVQAIGLSGQMHGTVMLDAHHAPLHPAIIWADQRSLLECHTLIQALGAETYLNLTGTLPATGFLGATLLWVKQHAPDTLAHIETVLLPKDYIRLGLTGELATEVSDAASTGLFNLHTQTWATALINQVGLPLKVFPPIMASTAVAGQLTPTVATQLGLPPHIPVIAGCADQPAQAIGNGLIAPGQASITIGSGGQVFIPLRPRPMPEFKPHPGLHVFSHAVPEMWYVLGAILSAGLALRWLRDLVGLSKEPQAYAILSQEAAAVPPGAHGLIFLPYLSGERTPHMNPLARGAFIGLTAYHQRGHMARAVMEGVAMALRQALELGLQVGGQVERIIAAGGGADSPVWRQILADVLGLPLQQTQLSEQAAVGAALLAGVGCGYYPDFATATAQVVKLGPITSPQHHATYHEVYARFLSLYPRLASDWQ